MNILESLNWRAAIKQFDTEKKVSQEDIDNLIEAANLTATSGGFQPFKLVVLSEGELKSQVANHAYGQPQVKDASHVLIFAIETNITEDMVDTYIERASSIRNVSKESFAGYANSMKMYISSMDDNAKYTWAKTQAFIALGTVLAAAAEMRVDSCPMEGFEPLKFQEILGLESKNLMPVAILPIGYRSENDVHSKEAKVRKTREEFVLELS